MKTGTTAHKYAPVLTVEICQPPTPLQSDPRDPGESGTQSGGSRPNGALRRSSIEIVYSGNDEALEGLQPSSAPKNGGGNGMREKKIGQNEDLGKSSQKPIELQVRGSTRSSQTEEVDCCEHLDELCECLSYCVCGICVICFEDG